MNPPFHLAFPVTDLEATRTFYADLVGCEVGRSAERWIDFNFFGHQISAHLVDGGLPDGPTNEVDGKKVPVQHFGAIVDLETWHELADRFQAAGREFIIEPYIRFQGEVGEQATMFLLDPSGNALEFKAFEDESQIFAK
ncbi:MAG: glyoxalase [Bacteroidetes bacterium]|nr:MAG: glyoxalase [Bacteroidota bacterium]PTM13475.1 MAG: glyoxalase [Bacteroidota bacterium]